MDGDDDGFHCAREEEEGVQSCCYHGVACTTFGTLRGNTYAATAPCLRCSCAMNAEITYRVGNEQPRSLASLEFPLHLQSSASAPAILLERVVSGQNDACDIQVTSTSRSIELSVGGSNDLAPSYATTLRGKPAEPGLLPKPCFTVVVPVRQVSSDVGCERREGTKSSTVTRQHLN